MIGSVAVSLRRAFGQQVARANAGQACERLGYLRREREAVDSYLAELFEEREESADLDRASGSHAGNPPAGGL